MAKEKEVTKNLATSELGKIRPGTLELIFERDIKLASIHKAVEAAVGWHGCPACGLNGFDLRFRVQDPAFEVFNKIEGLQDINVFR